MADATAAETATDTTESTDTTDDKAEQTETDWQAEAEKWKSQARKNEERAKENKKARDELDRLHKESMSESERAVAEAKDAGRSEALTEIGSRLVDAEFRVAAAGTTLEIDEEFLASLNRSAFLTDDGEPDKDAIKAWVDRIAPAKTETVDNTQQKGPLSDLDLGQGSNQHVAIGDDAAFQKMLTDLVNK
jgi:uncharacterized protein (DUF3084 family)